MTYKAAKVKVDIWLRFHIRSFKKLLMKKVLKILRNQANLIIIEHRPR